ncbi:MAG: hypothetical protein U9N45_00260, partial [Gemmatimonadota bacterium]|nr:hypothetical protein [Gemmatimonadota bacterium]
LGTESPYSRHFSLAGWERSRAGGVNLSTKAVPGLKLGAGFTQKHRKGALALREAGLNAKADLPGGVQLSGRLNVNLLSDKVQKGILRTRYTGLKKWIFMAEYKHYRPRLFYQSYFWRFNPRANNQVRGGATYFLRPELTLTAAVSSIFFEDEKNSYLSLGLCCPFGSATLYRGDGYGGDEFGFAAGADYPLNKRLELFTVLNYSRYRWYEEEDRDYFFSSIFGLNWRPRHHTLASLELQNLNSELISKDWRLLVKLSFNGKYIF